MRSFQRIASKVVETERTKEPLYEIYNKGKNVTYFPLGLDTGSQDIIGYYIRSFDF